MTYKTNPSLLFLLPKKNKKNKKKQYIQWNHPKTNKLKHRCSIDASNVSLSLLPSIPSFLSLSIIGHWEISISISMCDLSAFRWNVLPTTFPTPSQPTSLHSPHPRPRLIIRREKLRFSRYTWPSPPPLPLFPSLPFKERKSELIFHFTSSKVMTLLPHCQKSRVDINIGGGDVGDTN